MSARRRHTGVHQASPAGMTGEVGWVAATGTAPPDVPGPDPVAGPGPGTSTDVPGQVPDESAPSGPAWPGTSTEEQQDAAFLEQLHGIREDLAGEIAHEPGTPGDTPPNSQDLVPVDERELQSIRWASYDAAMAEAEAHRDRALKAALEALDRATRAAYERYGQAVDAADQTLAAARRAAVHARELALAGQAAR